MTDKTAAGVVTQRVTYEYDVFDRMVSRTEYQGAATVPTKNERFLWDGTDLVLTLNPAGTVQKRNLYGSAVDQVLASEDSLGQVLWPLADNQNTIRDAVNSSGTATGHRQYDSFGKLLSSSGSLTTYNLGYTGGYTDGVTGNVYRLHRWFDPSIGEWLSEDPIGLAGGDVRLHGYVGNEPTNFVDASGLCEVSPAWAATKSLGRGFGNLAYGGWSLFKETALYGVDLVGVTADGISTSVANYPLGYRELSSMGRNNQPWHPDFGRKTLTNTGRGVVAAGTFGISELGIANYDYARTGDADAYQQHVGTTATAMAAPYVFGRLPAKSNVCPNTRGNNGASSAAQARNLARQLTSEEQLGQAFAGKGKPLIGAGTNKTLLDAQRLAKQYGGDPADWAKMGSESSTAHGTQTPAGANFETHWYQNLKTGLIVEPKTKVSGH